MALGRGLGMPGGKGCGATRSGPGGGGGQRGACVRSATALGSSSEWGWHWGGQAFNFGGKGGAIQPLCPPPPQKGVQKPPPPPPESYRD